MTNDARIYVVVAEKVTTTNGEIKQPLGRQAAQACHVVGRLRDYERRYETSTVQSGAQYCQDVTTILLRARDSKELDHVEGLLVKSKWLVHSFYDTNSEYGEGSIKTAVSVLVDRKEQVEGILDYLPLWG